jgi:hypothetical protein
MDIAVAEQYDKIFGSLRTMYPRVQAFSLRQYGSEKIE